MLITKWIIADVLPLDCWKVRNVVSECSDNC